MPGLAPAASLDFFGPRGLLARVLPTYEERPAQSRLGYTEIAREQRPVALSEQPRRPARDELLEIGGVAPDQPRQRGIALPALGDQSGQCGSLRG